MSDGTGYMIASYVLTAVVLVGYAIRLAARGRAVRRRLEALARPPRIDAGLSGRHVTARKSAREPSHV